MGPDVAANVGVIARLSAAYLVLQAVALVVYWGWLFAVPSARRHFVVGGGPDSTLLPFSVADLAIYGSAATLCAFGLLRRKRPGWLFPLLCFHAGAAMYAAAYALGVLIWDPTRWLGAGMMLPALFVPPAIAWLHRPSAAGVGLA